MAAFSINVGNDGNKLVSSLGSQTSILEEFVSQFGEVVIVTTVDTLVIKEFLHTHSNKHKRTFHEARMFTRLPKQHTLASLKRPVALGVNSRFNVLDHALNSLSMYFHWYCLTRYQ